MSSRKTIYLSDKSEQILGPADSLSGRINTVISHYGRLTAEAAPTLTLPEWSLLCDMLNGTYIEDNTGDYLWADINESGQLDGLAEKWAVDTNEFSERVRAMPPAARFAILDVVIKFWKGRPDHNADMAAMLTEAGAKIA